MSSRGRVLVVHVQWAVVCVGSGCGGCDEARMAVGGMCYEEQLEKPIDVTKALNVLCFRAIGHFWLYSGPRTDGLLADAELRRACVFHALCSLIIDDESNALGNA